MIHIPLCVSEVRGSTTTTSESGPGPGPQPDTRLYRSRHCHSSVHYCSNKKSKPRLRTDAIAKYLSDLMLSYNTDRLAVTIL